mmetsp:Transcript_96276/g.300405  ORF Transcript_96276/g.300405 Transcript_96276/m.300405 type:complete len:345 (-) Transcript_96276:849-1883(-)
MGLQRRGRRLGRRLADWHTAAAVRVVVRIKLHGVQALLRHVADLAWVFRARQIREFLVLFHFFQVLLVHSRIGLGVQIGRLVLRGGAGEALRVERHNAAMGCGAQLTLVHPMQPDGHLADPLAGLQHRRGFRHVHRLAGVDDGAVANEEHAGRSLAGGEQHVADGHEVLRRRGRADHDQGPVADGLVGAEEVVDPQHRPHDRGLQLHGQGLREPLQQLHLLRLDPVLLLAHRVHEVLVDADRKLAGHAVVAEVPLELGELLRHVHLAAQFPEAGHGAGDAAHKGGEDHQREEQREDGEGALDERPGVHLRAGGRELRQGPVHGGHVLVLDVRIVVAVGDDPARL